MAKNRYFPFGYEIANGEIQTQTDEMLLVRTIFQEYQSGLSLQKLAETATHSGVPYNQGSEIWNKGMICRILCNPVYTGTDGYPPIVTPEEFEQANRLRTSKAKENGNCRLSGEMKLIRDLLCCAKCKTKLNRLRQKNGGIKWECPDCGVQIVTMTDEDLLETVRLRLNHSIAHPEQTQDIKPENKAVPIQEMRMKNQIIQAMNEPNRSADALLEQIKAYAAEQYRNCADGMEIENKQLMDILSQSHPMEKLEPDCFSGTVKRVLIAPDGRVWLELINQKVMGKGAK